MTRSRITRRDFLGGTALSLAAGTSIPAYKLLAASPGAAPGIAYPPALTGLRGSNPGSFEISHALAWEGRRRDSPVSQTDDTYDLVIVGGGLSGLAAAWYYRAENPGARILILDNHDDFGGHARRNEFDVDGHKLIGFGGSQSMESPHSYSPQAMSILTGLGIGLDRFYDFYDRDFYAKQGLGGGFYFDKEHYGRDQLVPASFPILGGLLAERANDVDPADTISLMPLSGEAKADLRRLVEDRQDYLAPMNLDEKEAYLYTLSYADFLRGDVGVDEDVVTLYSRTMAPNDGLSWDAIAAMDAVYYGMPGTLGLGFPASRLQAALATVREYLPEPVSRFVADSAGKLVGEEPYIFHFPDGNAGIARMMVRRMIPGSAAGGDMVDIITNPVDYRTLDRPENPLRIRLRSSVVDVRHHSDSEVDVVYVREGQAFRVRGRHCILACYNTMIPHLCSEVPPQQAEALALGVKTPIAYINVALRNWRAFANAGIARIYSPQAMYSSIWLDFPVSMGEYRFSPDPDQPILAHIPWMPAAHLEVGDKTGRELFREGQHRMYQMSFDDYENGLTRQLDGALGAHGFASARDIAAITVNRWPHGYAYWPMGLWDDYEVTDPDAPNVIGRAQMNRISIANSDAEGHAYVNGAFDAAWRAVGEQLNNT